MKAKVKEEKKCERTKQKKEKGKKGVLDDEVYIKKENRDEDKYEKK